MSLNKYYIMTNEQMENLKQSCKCDEAGGKRVVGQVGAGNINTSSTDATSDEQEGGSSAGPPWFNPSVLAQLTKLLQLEKRVKRGARRARKNKDPYSDYLHFKHLNEQMKKIHDAAAKTPEVYKAPTIQPIGQKLERPALKQEHTFTDPDKTLAVKRKIRQGILKFAANKKKTALEQAREEVKRQRQKQKELEAAKLRQLEISPKRLRSKTARDLEVEEGGGGEGGTPRWDSDINDMQSKFPVAMNRT